MFKSLTKINQSGSKLSHINELYHIDEFGNYKSGAHEDLIGATNNICGNCTNIWGVVSQQLFGNVTFLKGNITKLVGHIFIYGECSDISGNITYIAGDVTGFYGHCTGLEGYLDLAHVTDEERKLGINILDLVEVE